MMHGYREIISHATLLFDFLCVFTGVKVCSRRWSIGFARWQATTAQCVNEHVTD